MASLLEFEINQNLKQELGRCGPLNTYEEVLVFEGSCSDWSKLSIPLVEHCDKVIKNSDLENRAERLNTYYCHTLPEDSKWKTLYPRSTLPKTLVCHDYANGYHDDRNCYGSTNNESYTFHNWGGIDIFCYFSHHFVTIPPLPWINAAHKHGVKVIGTIITEWQEGEKVWEKILESEKTYESFAKALIFITKHFKFEGWLLNIENEVKKPQMLIAFIKFFYDLLHKEIENATLIWYDSIVQEGQLKWQNGLTAENKAFFDITDGILTNYSWTEADIGKSIELANERKLDVFIGVDVWGRKCYGGGKFDTDKALKLIHDYGCSMGIFAPGWTRQGIETPLENMTEYETFCLRDKAFWDMVWPYLNTHIPKTLPFQTGFCRGRGLKKYFRGKVQRNESWFNLAKMDYQPHWMHGPHGYDVVGCAGQRAVDQEMEIGSIEEVFIDREMGNGSVEEVSTNVKDLLVIKDELQCFSVHNDDAYNGGSCLLINHPKLYKKVDYKELRTNLLDCHFEVPENIVVVTAIKRKRNQSLHLYLNLEYPADFKPTVLLYDGPYRRDPALIANDKSVLSIVSAIDDRSKFDKIKGSILRQHPEFYLPTINDHGWQIRYFLVKQPKSIIRSVSCEVEGSEEGHCLLGHIGFFLFDDN